MKRIILTGGGTAGHVTPNIALIPKLQKEGFDIHYIGSYNGMEKKLIEELNIPYYGISTGKLRRYKDIKNLSDPFKVLKGCGDATNLIRKLKPNVTFSKGGFVSVPVIIGSKLNRVPSIIHESDMTPGLANKISMPFATKICCTFADTVKYLPKGKAILTGTPIRENILEGKEEKGYEICDFNNVKPVIMLIGGSLGSKKINNVIRKVLPEIIDKYQFVHLCGKGNIDESLLNMKGYTQFEYVNEELPHLFAMADLIISRAGANSISELLALKKPNILIPLSANASRGDHILNATSFQTHGYSYILEEEKLTEQTIIEAIKHVNKNKDNFITRMSHSKSSNGIDNVMKIINEVRKVAMPRLP
jgi:UDP-N-acetylglucosamine--N-acetylmuramyl-(pentapeptide) pyrophosphoryl-undecaprenol N-acetylglucosamine transferase